MFITVILPLFPSGVNSAISLRVNPSPKIFSITFSVWVVTDWLVFNLLNLRPADTVMGVKTVLAYTVFF